MVSYIHLNSLNVKQVYWENRKRWRKNKDMRKNSYPFFKCVMSKEGYLQCARYSSSGL